MTEPRGFPKMSAKAAAATSADKGERVAEKVATSLKEVILGGRLSPGDSLPSERELAERYDVNRSSVREALHRLEALGLVEMKHGGATRVRDFLLSAGLQMLPWIMAPGGKLDPTWLRDLLEVRIMLLGWCAEQAARKASADDVEALEELAKKLASPELKPARQQELDWAFYEALVVISNNRVLLLVSNAVREVYRRYAAHFRLIYDEDTFDPAHHRRTVEAIRARDAAAAGAAMRKHGEGALRTLKEKRP